MRSVLTVPRLRRRYPIRVSNWVEDPASLGHMFDLFARQRVASALFRRVRGDLIRFACFRAWLPHDYEELIDEAKGPIELVEEFLPEVSAP